ALAKSDVVILSIPVDGIIELLPAILDNISSKTTVIDVGSIKTNICKAVEDHPKRSRFVAAHPLAGTEYSGPKAALRGLYKGKYNIICEEDRSEEDALETAVGIFNHLGMRTMFMNPVDHDKHMAYVSHLSHISSFMLGQTVLDIEKDEKQIFNLASTGFESTVRLAKSSAETWVPIFQNNQKNISDSLEQYIGFLTEFKEALDSSDSNKMYKMILRSNEIKRILSGMKLNIVKLS
ncbi:MAG TPA: prephenate dehydrogenase, partial [Bacteroidetes bacterium]|nr:prephenate dehydrogenase [Bacteroidota bacterium]